MIPLLPPPWNWMKSTWSPACGLIFGAPILFSIRKLVTPPNFHVVGAVIVKPVSDDFEMLDAEELSTLITAFDPVIVYLDVVTAFHFQGRGAIRGAVPVEEQILKPDIA